MLEGARMALGAKGYPLSVHELIEIMPQFGARVGGEKPAVNLSSVLSKRGCGFQSVKWHGRHAWWFVDKPLPDAIALFEESESQTSQDKLSDSNPKQEDRENAATLNERTDR